MKTIVLLFTLSMVVYFTLCANENPREDDPDEFLEEIVHRERRDATQGKHLLKNNGGWWCWGGQITPSKTR